MTILIAVFTLFHPQLLTVRPATASVVHISWPETKQLRGRETMEIRSATKLEGDFVLAVPGRIERRFQGRLDVRQAKGELIAVLEAKLEPAVAAVVAAEMPGSFALEARRAQAIVARSWYAASRGRHGDYDFCDTTHCQVFKESSTVGYATLVLRYRGETLAALYSASCGGETMRAEDIGLNADGYPYFRVACTEHTEPWERSFVGADAKAIRLQPHAESVRLALGRALGWDALPGNNYKMTEQGDALLLKGKGRGHGLGLCQQGAQQMAGQGATAGQIVAHYYPNTTIGGMR